MFSGVRFSGYYQKTDDLIILVGLPGEEIILKLKDGFFVRPDLNDGENVAQGWKLKMVIEGRPE